VKKAGLILFLGAALAWADTPPEQAPAPSPERVRELVHMVRQECGSCHGMSLQGGLGPALTPEILRERPAESLVVTIIHGRDATPMPPWSRFLNEAEALWISERLLAGFPEE